MAEMMSPDQLKCLRCLLQRGLLFAFLLSLAPVLAQPKAFASLQPERIETGDTAGLLILVTGLNTSPKEVDFSPWASMFPPSNVIARSDWRRSGAQWTRRFTLIAFDSATLELPALNVRLATGNPLETNPVTLTVFPTRGGRDITDMAKIRDIHREPESWMDYWHWAALAAVLLFVCLWWVRKNKLKPPTATVQAPPVAAPVSASELALQKLAQLEQKALWKTGQTKAHCAELSLIVREYLELRYNIASLESTTNEIQAMLKTTDFPATLRTVLSELLQMTDLVKYAQSQPAETIQEAMLAKARTLVSPAHVRDEKPKQRETPPSKPKTGKYEPL